MIRLNKYLSDSGLFSRRKADEAIAAGQVLVNKKSAFIGQQINPKTDIVEYGGKIIKPAGDLVYYALFKPAGVVTTASDEHGRKTVLDFVPKEPRVFPIGRLDAPTLGLIILTNDGDLAQKVTHPSFQHEKEYRLSVRQMGKQRKRTPEETKATFERGILIDGKVMKADKVNIIPNKKPDTFIFDITLHTGYNRQIRKMSAKMGLEVIQLQRFRIGKLTTGELGLKPGQYKVISKDQIL